MKIFQGNLLKVPDWLLEIYKKTFKDEYLDALESLQRPTQRYYLRVNTAKITPDEAVNLLKEEGVLAYKDEFLEDAIYIEGYEINELDLLDSRVFAKLDAAESAGEGADLYRPGVIRLENAEKGSRVSVVTSDLAIACEGKLMMSSEEFLKSSKGLVVKNLKPKFKRPSIRSLMTYQRGFIYPQSLPSIITIHELNPKENEVIIDMCSSPGGKLSHIIAMTRGKAKIIACDKTENKIRRIKETLNLLGLPEPILLKIDSRYLDLKLGKNIADKIILDPSCSNYGLRPRITFNIPRKDPVSYASYQKSLLKAAYNLLKVGGICCYSVCTVTEEETKGILEYSIEELKMEPLPLNFREEKEFIHIFKPHKEDTPGFAIFKLKKIR